MAGTEYVYTIKFIGDQALADAAAFKTRLEARLGTINVKTKIDAGSISTDAIAKPVATSIQKAMNAAVKDLQQYSKMSGARNFLSPLQDVLQRSLATPTEGGVAAIGSLDTAMRRAQDSTAKLGMTLDQYMGASAWGRRLAAVQQAQQGFYVIRRIGFDVASLGRSMMAFGGVAVGGVVATAKAYLDLAGPLNRAARNLDLSAQLTEELDSKLRHLAGTISYLTPTAQAEVLYLWAAATGEVINSQRELDDVLARSQQIQKLMILGAVDQKTAVESVTDVISQYGLNVSDTGKIVDTFITVAANSKAEVSDLAMAFSYVGTRANAANTSFEETAAVMELLAAAGLRGSRAGRGVSRLLENLVAPSRVAQNALQDLFMDTFGQGTEILANAQGEFVGLGKAISILADATEDMTAIERANFIAITTTENASRALTPLLEMEIEARKRGFSIMEESTAKQKGVVSANRQAYSDMMRDVYGYTINLKSATDTAADYWVQYTNSSRGQMDRLKAAWSGALTTMGKASLSALQPTLEWIVDKVNDLSDAVERNPFTMDVLLYGGGLVVGIGALVTAFGKGLVLVADAKAILLGKSNYQAAQTNVAAAVQAVAAARTQMEAAILQAANAEKALQAAQTQAASAASSIIAGKLGIGASAASGALGAAGAAKLGLGAGAAGTAIGGVVKAAALPVGVGLVGGEVASKGLLGRDLWDMLWFKDNREAGKKLAEQTLEQGMSMGDLTDQINDLKDEYATLVTYFENGTLLWGKTFGGVAWKDIPEQYKPGLGAPSSTIITERREEVKGELEVLEAARRQALKESAESGRWAAQGQWWQENPDYKKTAEGIAQMTDAEVAAKLAQEALNRQVLAGKNVLDELGEALGLSDAEIDDWSATLFDGVHNAGIGMSALDMAIKMMMPTMRELSDIDIAIVGGQQAKAAWDSTFAGLSAYQIPYSQAEKMYDEYLAGLNAVLEESKGLTAAEVQWMVDEYNQGYQKIVDDVSTYQQQVMDMVPDVKEATGSFVQGLVGTMDYSGALDAGRQFQAEQEEIIKQYRYRARILREPIDFGALNFALGENAKKWQDWAAGISAAVWSLEGAKAQAVSSGWSIFEGLAQYIGQGGPGVGDIVGMYDSYKEGLDELIASMAGESEEVQKLLIAQYIATAREDVSVYGDTIAEKKRLDKEWVSERKSLLEQAEKGFRDLVAKGLEPTEVSYDDVMATKAGNYKDKWDEYARQIRAAMAGSQQWDWMIPADVKAGGEKAINEWGQSMLDNFYAGLIPDQVKWGPFIEQFKKGLAQQAGKEKLIETAISKLAEQGITATSDQVISALGLESPFQQYFFGGLTTDQASSALGAQTKTILSKVTIVPDDLATTGSSWASSMIKTMDTSLGASDLVSPLRNSWSTQLQARGSDLEPVGRTIGAELWKGVSAFISSQSVIDTIVAIVLDEATKAML